MPTRAAKSDFRFMKTLLAAFLLSSAVLHADLVIVQKVEGSGQSGEQTIRIKGDKARTDLAQQVSVLTDGATGENITLNHTQKTYLRISPAQIKAMIEQVQKMRPPGGEPPKLTPTGKKEKVGAFECEIFTTTFGGVNVTYWLAKDFPNFPAIMAQMEKLQAGGISAMTKGLMPDLKEFPGMQLKTEMDLARKKVTTTIISAKDDTVDPIIFVIPKDYHEAAAPVPSTQPK
jgi:hypothetical protein